MSKKTNTLLFILIATVFCIFVTVACFFVFLVIYSKFLLTNTPESMMPWIMPILFTASIAASFFAYRLALKILVKKIDIEKYFDPIFGRKRR